MGNCIRDECVNTRQKLNEARDRLAEAEDLLRDLRKELPDRCRRTVNAFLGGDWRAAVGDNDDQS